MSQPKCRRCKGSGEIDRDNEDGTYTGPYPCPHCEGSGIDDEDADPGYDDRGSPHDE